MVSASNSHASILGCARWIAVRTEHNQVVSEQPPPTLGFTLALAADQLAKTGDSASVRLFFAKIAVDERYGDLTPTIDLVRLVLLQRAWENHCGFKSYSGNGSPTCRRR
jgi:hypothetical protein